jgi:hypothetical protein
MKTRLAISILVLCLALASTGCGEPPPPPTPKPVTPPTAELRDVEDALTPAGELKAGRSRPR